MKYQILLYPLFCAEMRMDLRQHYRKMRRALSESERQLAARQLFSQFLHLPFLNKIQHIAVYRAVDGEVDPVWIAQWCWENQKKCYLPRLSEKKESRVLEFIPYQKKGILKLNQFNIPEPDNTDEIKTADQLDLILLPLVAFDDKGHRLGMGKGYYDATLSFLDPRFRGDDGVFLLGLGYEFQRADKLIPHEKDVDLDGMLTDQKLILFRR